MRALPPSRNRRAFPLSGGIGGFVPQSQPSGSQLGGGQLGGGRTPRSLEQVLSESGFQTPERPTGPEQQISVMFKDPLTGKMTSGGPHAKSHARAMSDFYAQNPEALEIAKQFEADRVAKANQGPSLASRVRQGLPPGVTRPTGGRWGPGPSDLAANQGTDTQDRQPKLTAIQRLQEQERMLAGPPQFAPPQQNPQPMFSQQDMSGMMRMMMQMFQQMMQGGMGQGSFNSGAFNNAPRSFYPQPYAMPQQSYAMPQQSYAPPPPRYRPARPPPYQRRQPTNFSGSPFGGY